MSEDGVDKILDECRKRRNLTENLRHRTFHEFGYFLSDMTEFLIFGEYSKDPSVKQFQDSLDRKQFDAEKLITYANLFLDYWKQHRDVDSTLTVHTDS